MNIEVNIAVNSATTRGGQLCFFLLVGAVSATTSRRVELGVIGDFRLIRVDQFYYKSEVMVFADVVRLIWKSSYGLVGFCGVIFAVFFAVFLRPCMSYFFFWLFIWEVVLRDVQHCGVPDFAVMYWQLPGCE